MKIEQKMQSIHGSRLLFWLVIFPQYHKCDSRHGKSMQWQPKYNVDLYQLQK